MKVVLAGPEEGVLIRHAYPAFAAAGFDVLAVVDTPRKLRDVAASRNDLTSLESERAIGLAVVEANVAASPDEALALLAALDGVKLAVILPAAWASERDRFEKLPGLVAGFSAPATWPAIAKRLAERVAREEHPQSPNAIGSSTSVVQIPAADHPAVRTPLISPPARSPGGPAASRPPSAGAARLPLSPVRLAFYGIRGGVGVSTAALAAARALAAAGRKVALFDAARRGDMHLMAGVEPADHPVERERITFFLTPPSEEHARSFDAVVVDGGRTRGSFNAEWITVSKPLSDERIRRLAGLKPAPQERDGSGVRTTPAEDQGVGGKKPRRRKLLSIEVTD